MTSASMPETNSVKPKSPPAPSSGPALASAPPVSHSMSPSRRAMNPSTLMPRKTWPVKEASMPDTLAHRYDDSGPRRRARLEHPAVGQRQPAVHPDLREEPLVVADHHERAPVGLQRALQLGDAHQVEVVR